MNGKVNILGKGETPFTATSEADIGGKLLDLQPSNRLSSYSFTGFTAHVLTTLPLDSPHLFNQSLRLEGDRLTFHDFARIYERPIAFVLQGEQVPGNSEGERQLVTSLQVEAEAGRASTGFSRETYMEEETAGSANGLWEGHIWDKINTKEN